MQKIIVFGLHGFLGQSADFDLIRNILPKKYDLITPNLFLNDAFDLTNFESVADQIFEFVSALSEEKIFIGYSLGGRIGLQVMKKYPNLFGQWIFLSTHPGLETDLEKQQRIQADAIWANKLNQLPWADFVNEWNSQAVFAGQAEPVRIENQFNKYQLTKAFLNLSLGLQADMSPVIQSNQKKIHWIVGERDQKFTDMAQHLKQKKILENYSRIFSGHRILSDAKVSDLLNIIF